jgi:hypothetical protein
MRIEPAAGRPSSDASASQPAGSGNTGAGNGTSANGSGQDRPLAANRTGRDGTVPAGAAAAGTGIAAGTGVADDPGVTAGNGRGPRPAARHSGDRLESWRRGAMTLLARTPGMLRAHWLASILIAGGVALRVLAQMAYHPAIIYIDTLKYLYDSWPGSDPVGYKVPLKLILLVGDLGTVEAVQHLLGIAIAIALYVTMVRRGVPRWLGALAIAPVLFDAYQVNVEAMIMPDIWFEALVVAGIVVLLWPPALTVRIGLAGGALLGASAGIRQVGEVLIIPVLIFVVALGGGWRKIAQNALAVTCAFALAVLFYLSADYQLAGHFYISRSSSSLTYGRMAGVADCKTLRLPKIEQSLCPTKAQQAMGPDKLDHSLKSPLRTFETQMAATPQLNSRNQLVANFNRAVETQQPLRVLSGILRDSVKLFALTRYTSPGDTPIVRWQFQRHYPTAGYGPWISVHGNAIMLMLGSLESHTLTKLNPAYGGPPQVNKPVATFLRYYQLHGGFTPGPVFLLGLLAGLAGAVIAFLRRRRFAPARRAAIAGLLFFATGLLVLGVSDLFEFTWRYQIPALVTLPPAGALGIAAIMFALRRPREPIPADTAPGRAPEMAAPAP